MSFDITVRGGTAVRLPTAGKYCADDIVVTATGGGGAAADPVIEPLEVTENGTYEAPAGVDGYSPVIVNVPTGGGEEEEWFNDGDTHIWVTLTEGRTSPALGVGVNGTVTVDWGDGTAPDMLTGTSTSTIQFTPIHEYAKPGDYVIRLSASGEMGITGNSKNSQLLKSSRGTTANNLDNAYKYAIKKIELGEVITNIGDYGLHNFYQLETIKMHDNIVQINDYSVNSCFSLKTINIPNSVTYIGARAFASCQNLKSIVIPNGVKVIKEYMFQACNALTSVNIPSDATKIEASAFASCYCLASINIPASITSIGGYAFNACRKLTSITIPAGVTNIENYTFQNCHSMRSFDFSTHTSVPTLAGTGAFSGIPADCEIRVPAALYDEWIAATNWSSLASKIVAV